MVLSTLRRFEEILQVSVGVSRCEYQKIDGVYVSSVIICYVDVCMYVCT